MPFWDSKFWNNVFQPAVTDIFPYFYSNFQKYVLIDQRLSFRGIHSSSLPIFYYVFLIPRPLVVA